MGACGDEMRYTMTGKSYFKLPPISPSPKGLPSLDTDKEDQFTSEDDDEVLANLAVGKKSSDNSSTTSSVSCLPPTPPTSESRPPTPSAGSTTIDSDIYDYCSAKEDSQDIVPLRPKLLLTQHKRKRGRPFGSVKTAQILLATTHSHMSRKASKSNVAPLPIVTADRAPSSFGYSSDDNSSRGTLDLIIPPPKDFQGINNPFLSQICEPQPTDPRTKAGAKTKKGSASGTSHIRLVRTVKRRLSARDIVIGPNMEVKRRKIRRSSGPFEVISTSTIVQTMIGGGHQPKTQHLPVRTDFKDLALSGPTGSTSSGLSPPPPPPPPPSHHVFRPEEAYGIGGRRLRKRSDTNYAENARRNSGNAVTLPGSTSSGSSSNSLAASSVVAVATTLNQIPGAGGSPVKGGAEVSLTELQSSLTMYFGAANRIANGERFSIRGRRVGMDGRNQFLIEWDTIA